MKASPLLDLFGDVENGGSDTVSGQADRLQLLKSALSDTHKETDSGRVRFDRATKTIYRGTPPAQSQAAYAAVVDVLEKSISADQLALLSGELDTIKGGLVGDITKDWTPSNPVGGTGLTAYDLEAPAKVLVPRYTPLRNSIPREKGQGNARKFKRIDSYTNAGVPGGAASALPFFSSATNVATFGGPGNLSLNRPPKITYTGSDHSVSYMELGFSDSVTWQAQFQGLGFDDIRGLSHTALLYSHLMGEERADLYGRGSTGNGYSGTVAAPAAVTTATATTGGTIADTTYYIYVVAYTGTGQSSPSTVASQVTSGGGLSTITVTVGTEPVGGIYYGLYVGTATGITNATLQTTFVGNRVTISSYTVGTTVGVAADSSYSALSYDGFLTVQSDPTQSGYFSRQNAALSATNPGVEFETAFRTMFVNNGADPDEVWTTGAIRQSINDLMRAGGASGAASGYRTTVVTGDGNAILGTVVGGLLNPNTSKVVDLRTHRFMLPGCALIRSLSLPLVDSSVGAPVKKINVQEYMGVNWPDIQMTYDTSTYQIGTLVHYAPGWSGLIAGIWSSSTAGSLN